MDYLRNWLCPSGQHRGLMVNNSQSDRQQSVRQLLAATAVRPEPENLPLHNSSQSNDPPPTPPQLLFLISPLLFNYWLKWLSVFRPVNPNCRKQYCCTQMSKGFDQEPLTTCLVWQQSEAKTWRQNRYCQDWEDEQKNRWRDGGGGAPFMCHTHAHLWRHTHTERGCHGYRLRAACLPAWHIETWNSFKAEVTPPPHPPPLCLSPQAPVLVQSALMKCDVD